MASSLFFLIFLIVTSVGNAHNITDILEGFPEYSDYNSFLTQTKVADEINSRTTITVLVLSNGQMSTLSSKHPLSVVKNALALHVLLDYYDGNKLHHISNGTTLTTTLYQTTGNAPGNLGFVNITDLKGGKVGFGSAAPGSGLDSTYTKSVKQVPYNISVLEISSPIIAPGILTAPPPSGDVNITGLLEKAGCKTFAGLILSSGVLKVYQTAAEKGLTLFAPNDEAFKAPKLPDIKKLSQAELVSLLQYHALGSYTPIGSLKTTKAPVSTLATSGAGKYDVSVTSAGDSVTIDTGVDSSRIASTVVDSTPLCIFTVDKVLLPTELFGKAPSPAPGLAPETSPSPAPEADSPSPEADSPVSEAPTPSTDSPASGPSADSESNTTDKSGGATTGINISKALVMVFASLAVSVVLS
ncbi:cell adhesion molecule [Lithospermum erythrorhizon]|uniref:Cell adhesion molecule n=1 Tax=Lithospermum erythrorhizon TaxID=34254 RepID=A0AAV3RYN8_LITER